MGGSTGDCGALAMTDPCQAIDSESWDFALKLYAEPGIADACLRLQAESSVDVIMLLMATFAAVRRGVVLTPSDIADMDAACRSWREHIVLPLRALRTTLKTGPAPAPSEGTEKLRLSIKAAELSAERLQNQVLAHWLGKKPSTSRAVKRVDILAVLHSLASSASQRHRGAQADAQLPAIETIVDAAIRLAA
jgi:uncharacterized protein (TIGR02444 family)